MNQIGGHFTNGDNYSVSRQISERIFSNNGDTYFLRSGTDSLKLIIAQIKKEKKKKSFRIMCPDYTCPTVYMTLRYENLEVIPYRIQKNLTWEKETMIKGLSLGVDAIILTDYFGLKQFNQSEIISFACSRGIYCIMDQVGIAREIRKEEIMYPRMFAFNSARKFSFLADGSQLTGKISPEVLEGVVRTNDVNRILNLKKKLEFALDKEMATDVVNELRAIEQSNTLDMEIRFGSSNSKSAYEKLDFRLIEKSRIQNYNRLLFLFSNSNYPSEIKILFNEQNFQLESPLYFLISLEKRRDYLYQFLLKNNIYAIRPWRKPSTKDSVSFNNRLSHKILALPIDQRHSTKDMTRMFDLIVDFFAVKDEKRK